MKRRIFALLLVLGLTVPTASAQIGDYEAMVAKGLAECYAQGMEPAFTAPTDETSDPYMVMALARSVMPYSNSLEQEWGGGYTTYRMAQLEPVGEDYLPSLSTIDEIHDYILEKTEYDPAGPNAYSPDGALVDGRAVCDGYSTALLLLCQRAGIPCLYIGVNALNHSYNLVWQDGEWYIVDATWDDTSGGIRRYFMKQPQSLPDHLPSGEGELLLEEAIAFGEWYYGLSGGTPMTIDDVELMTQPEMAAALRGIGMFLGTGEGFELERAPTRMELSVMFVRALGLEEEALTKADACTFADVPDWGRGYAALLYERGLARGYVDGKVFGAADIGSARDYATFLLRAMGFSEEAGDFEWQTADETAAAMGFAAGVRPFLRGDVAEMTIRALLVDNASFAGRLGITLAKA